MTTDVDDATAREFADSIVIEEAPLEGLSEYQHGQVLAYPGEDGWEFYAVRKAGLSEEFRQGFDAWARQRAYMLALTGDVEADGWFKRESDDGWQITGTAREINDPFAE